MTTRADHRRRGAAITAAVACLWVSAATAQQSGTVFGQTMTFLAAPSATMQFDIAGFKAQGTQTVLNLEFGPDGNGTANPSPDPNLPAGVSFVLSRTINGVLISKTFSKAGIDDLTTFPGKEIIFNHPTDATNAPGFYKLTVVHTQDVPVGTTETWNLAISGLPAGRVLMHHYRVDGEHSNSYEVWKRIGSPQSPTAEQYSQLEREGKLRWLHGPGWHTSTNGTLPVKFALPRQGVSLIVLNW